MVCVWGYGCVCVMCGVLIVCSVFCRVVCSIVELMSCHTPAPCLRLLACLLARQVVDESEAATPRNQKLEDSFFPPGRVLRHITTHT